MSIQNDYEESRDTYNALINCRSELESLESKRDALELEMQELERRISDYEEELGID